MPIIKNALRLGLVLVAVFTLTACDSFAPDQGVLTDKPCAPPCWQGISPGDSMTADQVTGIVKSLRNIERVWQPIPASVSWWWRDLPGNKSDSSDIYLAEGKVLYIHLSINFNLTVEQIIKKYGLPKAVTTYDATLLPDEPPYINFIMYYPELGLSFIARPVPWKSPTLETTTQVVEATYTLKSGALENWQGLRTTFPLHPWPGYGKLVVDK